VDTAHKLTRGRTGAVEGRSDDNTRVDEPRQIEAIKARPVLRYAELLRVLGRRLTDRVIRAGWIVPVPTSVPAAIFFDRHDVHLAA
jgi:hypothetical protein